MPRFTQNFKVHAVGQGLFYSGEISLDQQSFKMVFDCGSYNSAAILREIAHFESTVMNGSDELDLLVISHFDEDHVNHIEDLLHHVRRIKKLVMPFLTFSERLLLVTRFIARRRGYRPGDDLFINFILDPMSLLGDYLDGDSAVFLVDHAPGPIKPIGADNETLSREGRPNFSEGDSFSFDFNNKQLITRTAWVEMKFTVPKAELYAVTDAEKATLSFPYLGLMEFLFYKRSLGPEEARFYQLVEEFFIARFAITELTVNGIVSVVKTITNATEVKRIFRDAARICRLPLGRTANMNTTALCMLHRNLRGIIELVFQGNIQLAINETRPWFWNYHLRQYFNGHPGLLKMQKQVPYYNFPYGLHDLGYLFFVYPNTLLTSDTFLSSVAEMAEFDIKYEPYFKEIWLFQIPHHGSDYNIRQSFFTDTRYRRGLTYFINHGLKNRSGHPDESIIIWAQPGEPCRKLRLIHDLQGMEFGIELG